MTETDPRTPPDAAADPSRARPKRAAMLAEELGGRIRAGEYEVGDKLPSEAALTRSHGVSRTVVREAMASLRAEGLVASRQGAGVFVISDGRAADGAFQNVDPEKIGSIIEMLELRAAVEVEAAALAARRRSPAQEDAIFAACSSMERVVERGEPSLEPDYVFHRAVAEATGNPRFAQFMELIGLGSIPRAGMVDDARQKEARPYLTQILAEHRAIAAAIASGDEEAAKAAMRRHLVGSQQRYREMLRRV
ncbi:FadR/GntR family transcriptional regulator [Rhodovulum sp. DZ06]|uniref:FadR/GntR family transcriptional regulator n=1 Tax=Rhodovulum sp. DZ06 TaxID=3425126 RepID=UPI003D3444FE